MVGMCPLSKAAGQGGLVGLKMRDIVPWIINIRVEVDRLQLEKNPLLRTAVHSMFTRSTR